MLFFTNNRIASLASNILDSERITEVFVQAWAGQSGDAEFFCVGNDGSADRELTLYPSSPNIQISNNGRTWDQSALDYSVKAGAVGDAVFVRVIADLDTIEGDRVGLVHADEASLTVRYFLAEINEGDTDRSQAYRFSGDNTFEVREFFETDGEALRLIEYEPQPKPLEPGENPLTRIAMNNRTIREWCNPHNKVVGFKAYEWTTKGFVGDRDQLLNSVYDVKAVSFTFGDSNAVLLAHDFEGFDPSWRKALELFSVDAFGRGKYQGTTWTLYRDNQEYALRNIRRVGFFKGQILFYFADLERIHYPGGIHETSFLPWNELLDAEWKPIDYVRSWSTTRYEEAYEYVDGYS
jgi:hypothetical protein